MLRIWFSAFSYHVYYPDEIFQTLEQAYRIVHGYGIIPWEFTWGVRSWVPALFLSVPLRILDVFGISNPANYTLIMRIFLSSLSLVVIPAMHSLGYWITRNRSIALLAAFAGAVWYELIYFSPRAFTEIFSLYLFSGFIILFTSRRSLPYRMFWMGFLLSFAGLIRLPYMILTIPIVIALCVTNRSRLQINRLILGTLIPVLLFGLSDLITYGGFLSHASDYLRLTATNGLNHAFGVKPWWDYFLALLITSGGLVLFAACSLENNRSKIVLGAIGLLLISHSVLAHKEYRFIIVVIPLLLTLTISGLMRLTSKLAYQHAIMLLVLLFFSYLGFSRGIPLTRTIYAEDFLAEDMHVAFLREIADAAECGVYDVSNSWVWSGGYYMLGRDIPLYSSDYQPQKSAFSDQAFTIDKQGKPTMYTNMEPCNVDPEYSFERGFGEIDTTLHQMYYHSDEV